MEQQFLIVAKFLFGLLFSSILVAVIRENRNGKVDAAVPVWLWMCTGSVAAVLVLTGVLSGAPVWGGIAGVMVVCVFFRFFRGSKSHRNQLRTIAIGGIALVGFLSWTNFGTFHGSSAIHWWDSFHYYVGGKYFAELEYTDLYNCTVVAQLGDVPPTSNETMRVRDLRTNRVVPLKRVFEEYQGCGERFGEQRFEAFSRDALLFRSFFPAEKWKRMFTDHGFNATPFWIAFWRPILNMDWESWLSADRFFEKPDILKQHFQSDQRRLKSRLLGLVAADVLSYIGILFVLWWGFGPIVSAVGMIVLGFGDPWTYQWIGGGIGRNQWLLFSVVAVSALAKGRIRVAGASLGLATCLRIFPIVIAAGPLCAFVGGWFGSRGRPPRSASFIIWSGLSVLVCLVFTVVSLWVVGEDVAAVFSNFSRNTQIHQGSSMSNLMGLFSVLGGYPPQALRGENWGGRETVGAVLWICGGALSLVALVRYRYRLELWESACLGSVLFGTFVVSTCYDFVFFVLLSPLVKDRVGPAAFLLGTVCATQVVAAVSGGAAFGYALITILFVCAGWYISFDLIRERKDRDLLAKGQIGE